MHIKIPDQLFIYTIEFDYTFKIEEEKLYINMLNEECVEWGVQLLLMRFDHISVTNLAGLTKPYNYNEVKKYFVDVINDLKVEIPSHDDIVMIYAKYIINEALNKNISLDNSLNALYQLTKLDICFFELYIFYKLYFAYEDLKENTIQFYVEGATQKNIKPMILDTYRKWLSEN